MTSFKVLGATLVLSALLATPASAWEAISDPDAALAQDPTFSVYSNGGYSNGWPRIFGYDGLADTARPHVGTAYVDTAASRKSHRRRQALLNTSAPLWPQTRQRGEAVTCARHRRENVRRT